jgi:hypothetical protein
MGKQKIHTKFGLKYVKEIDHLEDNWIVLKWILQKYMN